MTKITPEQIESFESRAAAGEVPTPGMWGPLNYPNEKATAYHIVFLGSAIRIFDRVPDIDYVHLCFGAKGNGTFVSAEFETVTAAQLCAEHLLREATAPLRQARVDELEADAARLQDIVNRMVRSISKYDPYEDTKIEDGECQHQLVGYAWGKIARMACVGSTSAKAMCVDAGIDPDFEVKFEHEEEDDQ